MHIVFLFVVLFSAAVCFAAPTSSSVSHLPSHRNTTSSEHMQAQLKVIKDTVHSFVFDDQHGLPELTQNVMHNLGYRASDDDNPWIVIFIRSVIALMGSFIADAAQQPVDYFTDQAFIANLCVTNGGCAYIHPSYNPVYTYQDGSLGNLGQLMQFYAMGGIRNVGWNQVLLANYIYGLYNSVPCNEGPSVCYQDETVQQFIENMGSLPPPCGAFTTTGDVMAAVVPTTITLAGYPAFLPTLSNNIQLLQVPMQVHAEGLAAGRLLEHAILNGTGGAEAVTLTIAQLRDPNRYFPTPYDLYLADNLTYVLSNLAVPPATFVNNLCLSKGYTCTEDPFPLMLSAYYIANNNTYQATVNNLILGAGEIGSRALLTGAFIAAVDDSGKAAPVSWLTSLTDLEDLLSLSYSLAYMRPDVQAMFSQ